MLARELHTQRILTSIEAGGVVSQRSLAREAGIALGLANLLLRRLVRKGWVKIIKMGLQQNLWVASGSGS